MSDPLLPVPDADAVRQADEDGGGAPDVLDGPADGQDADPAAGVPDTGSALTTPEPGDRLSADQLGADLDDQ